jgi:pyruvate,orthophosphate dikinase
MASYLLNYRTAILARTNPVPSLFFSPCFCPALDHFQIETPIWGFADTGTRFGKFLQDAAPIDFKDKLADAGQIPYMIDRSHNRSVRSGARDSMPGMMDTILNLGMNDEVVEVVAEKSGNPRFAWDSYRRFLQMYGDVVMGVQTCEGEDHEPFETVIEEVKHEAGVEKDMDLAVDHLKVLVEKFKGLIKERTGETFPQDPRQQLWGSIGAVFGSWNNDRAIVYRRKYSIPHGWGTAVNVQTMVFGNRGDTSATGVAFTRDPATGEKVFYGEYLINAQGEDVVAGVRTPHPVAMLAKEMPAAHKELLKIRDVLEKHFHDMQDLEFS